MKVEPSNHSLRSWPCHGAILAGCFLLGLPLASTSAQEGTPTPELTTGPVAGSEIRPVQGYGVGGPHPGTYAGREWDVSQDIGNGPGALLFMHELTRNILPVIRGLDRLGVEYGALGFENYTLFLTDDRTASETKLKAVNSSLKLHRPILLSLDGPEGPGDYALNRKGALSLILFDEGKVVKSIAFTDVNAEDEERVRNWIESLLGDLPESPDAYREKVIASLPDDPASLQDQVADQAVQLRQLTRQVARLQERLQEMQLARMLGTGPPPANRNPNPRERMGREPREARPAAPTAPDPKPDAAATGAPPTDPELSELFRSLVRQNQADAQVDEIHARILARVKESPELKTEVTSMYHFMLRFPDRYGSDHARALATRFVEPEGGTPPER